MSMPASIEIMKEGRWDGVVSQERDFSCGAAAVATLLSYHFGRPMNEVDVFQAMFEKGDKQRIMSKGFSLLDMKEYLHSVGVAADGFRISLDSMMKSGIPGIALISFQEFRHFVVIKEVTPGEVLIGDPARGMQRYSRGEFKRIMASDIIFLIRT